MRSYWRIAAALAATLLIGSCGGGRSATDSGNPTSDDLSVTQTGPATVAAGTTLTFVAVVVSSGRFGSSDIVVEETLTPGYTSTVTCEASFGAICPTALGPSITVPSLAAGRYVTLTYSVQVPVTSRGEISHTLAVRAASDAGADNNTSTVTTLAVDGRNGTYQAYAADGRQYVLDVDFDALTYKMTGDAVNDQKSFVAANGEYVVAGNQRLRTADDLIVGSHDFGAGLVPYVAARRFATTVIDGVFNLATRDRAADGTYTTHPGTARISGNVLSICQLESSVSPTQNCPVVLTTYSISVADGVFTGVGTSGTGPITFRIARSGATFALLASNEAADGSRQFRIGLQESAGLSWGTLHGPTETGDWVTMVLNAANVSYAVLGSMTNDQAGLQKIANVGPFAMMVGKRFSDSADIYVLQTAPLAVEVGAVDGTASGSFEVALP